MRHHLPRFRARVSPLLVAVALLSGAVPGCDANAEPLGNVRYVSCHGNDRNTGTTPSAAWRSLTRANRVSLRPGDRLLLGRGCVWDGDRLDAHWNGTASRPVTIGAYGRSSLPRPLIRNGDRENVLVTGSYLVITSLQVTHDAVRRTSCGQPVGDYVGFEFTRGAHHVTVTRSRASGEMAGVRVEASAHHIRVVRDQLVGNGVVQDRRELGAWGVLLDGNDNEVAWSTFRGNRSRCLMSGGRYASNSVELFGASRNHIHHNRSYGDRVFSELGSPSTRISRDNRYGYNVFVPGLPGSRFITTRGGDSSFGPVLGTTLLHNSTYQTGKDSQGVVCGGGCGPDVLAMRANIVWAQSKVLYIDGTARPRLNLFWNSSGAPVAQINGPGGPLKLDATNLLRNPRWVDPGRGNLLPQASSPALDIDAAASEYRTDLVGTALPQNGATDAGALERPAPAG